MGLIASKWLLLCFVAFAATNVYAQSNRRLEDLTIKASPDSNTEWVPSASSGSLYSGQSLKEVGVLSASDLTKRVPGVAAFGALPRSTGLSIRGVGSNQINDGVGSSVGVYIDEVYQPRQSITAFPLYDVEYVEVLRGPQGQSYGIGSTAGDVLIATRRPTDARMSGIDFSLGTRGYQSASAYVSGPIVDGTLNGRVSLFSQVKNGELLNNFSGAYLNEKNRFAARGQLQWRAPSGGAVRLIAEYGLIDQVCCDYPLLGPVSKNVAASDAYMQYDRPGTHPYDRVTSNDAPNRSKQELKNLSLIGEWSLGQASIFKSISSLNHLAFNSVVGDNTSMRLLTGKFNVRTTQFVQELRMTTEFKRLKTTGGVFYLRQRLNGSEVGVLGDEIALWTLGGQLRQRVPGLNKSNSAAVINAALPPQTLDGLNVITPDSQTSGTASMYVSNELVLKPDTKLLFGVRSLNSVRSGEVSRYKQGGNLDASPLSVTNGIATLGGLLGVNTTGLTFENFIDNLVGRSFQRTDSRQDSGISASVGLAHQVRPGVQAYAKWVSAFKSGGLNLAGTTSKTPVQFAPERALGTEVGLGFDRPGSGFSGNLAVYATQVRNFQAVIFDEGEGLIPVPRQANVLNVPEVSLRGVEWAGRYKTADRWTFSTGMAYNRAISTRFTNASNEDTGKNDKDLSGQALYNAPRWTGYVGVEKGLKLASGQQVYAAADGYFKTSTFGAVEQSRRSFLPGYQIMDLRLGMRSASSKWTAEAWVRNVFNRNYLTAIATVYGISDYGGLVGDQRLAGVTTSFQLQ